jgi:ADP-heptose:LPS heptosyltransferase
VTKEKILVIKLGALGDFVLAMGAMEAIRRHHPQAEITLLTTRPFVDLAQRSRWFNHVLIDQRPKFYELVGWVNLAKKLNAGQFTRVYDLQMNDRTAMYYRLFLKKPEWSGKVKGASHLFKPAPDLRPHAFFQHRAQLKELGIEVGYPDLSWMTADISLFGLKRPYVLFVPGSAPHRPEKRWPALKYAALAIKFMRRGYDVVLLGGPAERDIMDKISQSAPGVYDFSGRTSFFDIVSLAKTASGAVGNDTGPMHFIAAAGCPAVSLFSGASDPLRAAPVGAAVTVMQADLIDDLSVDEVMKNLKLRDIAA